MTNVNFGNGIFPHMKDIANYHPAVIAWFEHMRLDYPYRKDFALACNQVIQQIEVPIVSDRDAYTMFARLVGLINEKTGTGDIAVMSFGMFNSILESARRDSNIAELAGNVPLMIENGPAGELRKALWHLGLREPGLSINVYKMANR